MMQGPTMLWLIQQEREREIGEAARARLTRQQEAGPAVPAGRSAAGRALVLLGLGLIRLGMSTTFRR